MTEWTREQLRAFREKHNGVPTPTQAATAAPTVIDISHWNGFPDFEKVAASGIIGVILKATEGTDYVDPNRAKNFSAAMKAGLLCCCYFWLKPGDGAAQAQFFLQTIQPVAGERVIIDYEEDGCTLDMLKDAVAELLAYGTMDSEQPLQVTIYSGHLLKEQLGDTRDDYLADNTDLWLAQYTTGDPSWPEGTYPEWSLWQYSQTGSVPGVDGDCDLDRFNGSPFDLVRWLSPANAIVPEPDPDPQGGITIYAPPNMPIYVNGVRVA